MVITHIYWYHCGHGRAVRTRTVFGIQYNCKTVVTQPPLNIDTVLTHHPHLGANQKNMMSTNRHIPSKKEWLIFNATSRLSRMSLQNKGPTILVPSSHNGSGSSPIINRCRTSPFKPHTPRSLSK